MNRITPNQLREIINKIDFQLIDIREVYERTDSTIPGSIHIPMGDLISNLSQLDPTKKTVIFCNTGRRSEPVVNLLLKEYQFKDVSSLDGGISAWNAL